MNDVAQPLVPSALTLTAGIVLYAVSRLLFEPMLVLRGVIGEIHFALGFHARSFGGVQPHAVPKMNSVDDVALEFRQLGARLSAQMSRVPMFPLVSTLLRALPAKSRCELAWRNLIAMSNSIGDDRKCEELRREICRDLGLEWWLNDLCRDAFETRWRCCRPGLREGLNRLGDM